MQTVTVQMNTYEDFTNLTKCIDVFFQLQLCKEPPVTFSRFYTPEKINLGHVDFVLFDCLFVRLSVFVAPVKKIAT